MPTLEVFKSLLYLYGTDASVPEKGTLNIMSLTFTSHFNETSFEKMKALVLSGVNISARVDEEFQNTILHYLIALEHNAVVVLKLIEFMESVAECHFDYTLQDKFGKTPLLLAVGLNNKQIVEKLLNLVSKKNKKILVWMFQI